MADPRDPTDDPQFNPAGEPDTSAQAGADMDGDGAAASEPEARGTTSPVEMPTGTATGATAPGDVIGRADVLAAVRENASRFRWMGIGLIVAGALAILFPLIASIAVKVMIGWLLLLTGAVTLWHAFQAKDWSSAIWQGVIAVLHLIAGVYLAFFPFTGLIALTTFLAILFLVQGGFEIAIASQHRERRGWGWLIASGVVSVLAGGFLILGLPGSAAWAIGLLAGLVFLSTGISMVGLASAAETEA